MSNFGLKWETTTQYNAGIDLSMFRNRLEFVADIYHKNTRDLLVQVPTAPSTGYSRIQQNFATMTNRGLEMSVTGRIFTRKPFSWDSSFNISFNKTKVGRLTPDYFESGMALPWNAITTQILIQHEELGIFWGYKRDGIRQEGDPELPYTVNGVVVDVGDQKYVNRDGNGVINSDDKMIIGRAQPLFVCGFNNSFSFKGFDLTIYIDGSYGNDICNMNRMRGMQFGSLHQFAEVMNRWTRENPSDIYPKVRNRNNAVATLLFSDLHIEDGSFLRIQNINLGYALPSALTQKISISKARVFASIQNVHTFTKYSGYTPDVSINRANNLQMGHDNGAYPTPVIYNFGINLTF